MKTENKHLLKIQKLLNNKYFTYFVDDNILSISEDKTLPPFVHFIMDDEYNNIVVAAFAVDFPDAIVSAEVVLLANKVIEVGLGNPFYIAKNGNTYFDEEAYEMYSLDDIQLEDWDPKSDAIH